MKSYDGLKFNWPEEYAHPEVIDVTPLEGHIPHIELTLTEISWMSYYEALGRQLVENGYSEDTHS